MYKIIGADSREYGPITIDQIREWIRQGRVNASTMVQAEGSAEWKSLSSFSEFAEPGIPPLVSGYGMTPEDQRIRDLASKKLTSGICGILIGALGIHKFILGYNTAGIIMLVVTVATCFWGAIPMGIIGLIEGIIYLTKSDREFVETYVQGKREWF